MTTVTEISAQLGDVLINWDAQNARGDWTFAKGGLATTQTGFDALKNVVLISLFTDARAPSDYTGPYPRGWWGNTYRTRPLGSLLWTLNRSKIANRTTLLQQARTICRNALQWMVDDTLARSVDVACGWATTSTMAISVTVTRPNGQTSRYSWLWQGF